MNHRVPRRNREDTAALFYYDNSFKKPHLFAKQIQLLNLLSIFHRAYTRFRQRVELTERPASPTTSQDGEGSMMKSEDTHRLCRDELTRLDGEVAGRIVSCSKGVLWLTQAGTPGDHLIRAGEAFPIDRPGLVLISALEDSAYAVSGGNNHPLGSEWSFMPAFRRMVRRFEAARKSLLT
jgi:hypothetical protein